MYYALKFSTCRPSESCSCDEKASVKVNGVLGCSSTTVESHESLIHSRKRRRHNTKLDMSYVNDSAKTLPRLTVFRLPLLLHLLETLSDVEIIATIANVYYWKNAFKMQLRANGKSQISAVRPVAWRGSWGF